jgi:hypothetical protein
MHDKVITVYAYKITYNHPHENTPIEIFVFDIKNKEEVLEFLNYKSLLPFYMTVMLFILKIMYYKFKWISTSTYTKCKKYIINNLRGVHNEELLFFASNFEQKEHECSEYNIRSKLGFSYESNQLCPPIPQKS